MMKRKEALLSLSAVDTSFVCVNLTGEMAKFDSYAGFFHAKVNIYEGWKILLTYVHKKKINRRQYAQCK